MILIIVESPSKAKAIAGYLKKEKTQYTVLSTYGHIRTLDNKAGSIDPQNEYSFKWKTTPQWAKNKATLLASAKEAEKIIVATDLDREGEGIAWHFLEELKAKKIVKPTERITFDSISKDSILDALKNIKEIRTGLIESYLARTGLDYLFGYSISPLLWRKVPACKSAGRVQSVALRLIVERENEILNFKSKKYLTVHAQFKEAKELANLVKLNDAKFENGQIFDKEIDIKELEKSDFKVASIKQTQSKQNAPAPFITSSLLQSASSVLNLSPKATMQLAQKLYEGFTINGSHTGLITYMRTDSTTINPDFITKIRAKIKLEYGNEYLPASKNTYKIEKNAQEAHEAIRCVDINITNVNLGDKNLERLYKLIWNRTMASQMKAAIMESTNTKIVGINNETQSFWEIKTSKTLFKGFKILVADDEEEKEQNAPDFKEDMPLACKKITSKEHETQPPKRYSEANLIQQMKKQGIGRPSTYANIIQVLYDRDYAAKEKKIIVPTTKGWIVTAFLKHFFPVEVAYEFTANMENQLDELNESNKSHKEMLAEFWNNLESKIASTKDVDPITTGINLQKEFGTYFLAEQSQCPKCKNKLLLKFSKFGAMLGCEKYPDCKEMVNIGKAMVKSETKSLGEIDGCNILLKSGPYGPYIEQEKTPIKRAPIPKAWQKNIEEVELKHAKFLLSLPLKLGVHENEEVSIGIGRFGPFMKYKNKFYSVKEPMEFTISDAIALIKSKS